ncbi:glycerol kinase GlpK [Aliifodinibius sp. S!AR15-10]|uniref:glycerol kinase GlpK n=1 Tax=Aliifodinibius sp. S!AR15-10 TaxID=2950437 RepID=UPI002856D7F8|nr:glycerol kinase GlpK [Aliifodinibius sp. S!AR15-10]MDR8392003.1 glycerol kinase GlpK [Aliifodinibius sp. S!AR15-10]
MSKKQYILSFDQGTTSSRAILFDNKGRITAVAQKEFEQRFPKPGWVEHDPNDIWSSQISVAAEVVSRAGIKARDIAAIGITNQRETTVVWDRKTGEPVYNAIVWQDRRTASLTDQLEEEGLGGLFQQKTGLVLDPYFSGTKIKWILDNVEGAREKAENGDLVFGTIDTWLIWNMTNGDTHVTDVTNASRTLLYNIHNLEWDPELLEILDIPESMLPEVASSSEVYAKTAGDIFATQIPIAGIAGDQQAALFGQICTQKGMAKNTYGTGCFMLMNTGPEPIKSENNLLTTIAWQQNGQVEYALEGSVFIGGAVVQWLRDGLKVIKSSSEVEALASEVESTDGVYLVPAFSGLGAPHWDPHARGTMAGITRGTTSAHIARAALEAIAFQSTDLLKAMESDSGISLKELRVDGGASVNNLLMQFQADLLRVPVIRPEVTETTALGAAYLAGLAVGFWENRDEISQQWNIQKRYEPGMERAIIEEKYAGWHQAVERAKGWKK